jgi:putative FmdB family regulatory protein
MPIYEYKCNKCGHIFETLVLGKREPDKCESCESDNINKLMSACGFLSKNSSGETISASAGSSSCGDCSSTSCATT